MADEKETEENVQTADVAEAEPTRPTSEAQPPVS